ncbi:MAG: C40 family peptidase [Kineosporiaceae bacterium]|nr:C40 family peptidase [Kineosporiaceae bacterium]
MSRIPHRRLPALVLASCALATSALVVPSTSAGASPLGPSLSTVTAVAPSAQVSTARTAAQTAALAKAQAVLRTAASLKGRPYRYGASGPRAFDCSGYTKYVFSRNGIALPRTAQQQWRKARKIKKSQIRPGDLVFFGGAHKYHVAVYAGNGMIWHAPSSGKTVRKVKIWTSRWSAGRIIG